MPLYISPLMPKLNDQLFFVIVSWTYKANSFTSVCPWNKWKVLVVFAQPSAAAGVGLVRSKQPSRGRNGLTVAFGFVPSFGVSPAPPHCVGSVKPGCGFPSASRHGEFSVGLTIARLSFSVRNVCS